MTDALGQVTSYEYSPSGKKAKEVRPSVAGQSSSAHVITYEYDEADRLVKETHVSQTGGNDRSILYAYDIFDRLTSKTLMHGATVEDIATYTYENQLDAESMATANNNVANLSFSHEPAPPFAVTGYGVEAAESGNPKGLIEDTFTVGRDVNGNVASVVGTTSGNIFTKAYDEAGRLTGFNAKDGALKGAVSYDGFGRKQRVSFSDGTSGDYAYDLLNRVVAINWKEKHRDSVRESLVYDLTGNITHMAREHSTYDLTYDAVDQLVSSKMKGMQGVPSYNREFGYDAVGNRLTDSQNGTGNFVSNFLTQNGNSSFTASPDGFGEVVQEITGDKVKNYAYRADGKISYFQSGNQSVSYFYDGLDRLIAKAINDGSSYTQSLTYLADEKHILFGRAGGGSITTYVDDQGSAERLGEVKNGVGKGYITDHLGSVLNSPVAGYWEVYGLYGELPSLPHISQTVSPITYGFTGHVVDLESGLNRTDYRQFDTKSGRWLSQDPAGHDGGDENFYRYALNKSLTLTDFDGLEPRPSGPSGSDASCYAAFSAALRACSSLTTVDEKVKCNKRAEADFLACEKRKKIEDIKNSCLDPSKVPIIVPIPSLPGFPVPVPL